MRLVRRWLPAVSVALVITAIVLLASSGAIGLSDPPDELGASDVNLSFLAGLIAVGIGLTTKPARIAFGVSVLAVTVLVAVGGMTGSLAFYDSGGLGLALGIACLVATWLILAGRRVRPPWSRDLPRRALTYLTIGVVVVPSVLSAGVTSACAGSDGDDDLCGLGWFVIGVPAACLVWLLTVVAAEVAAAVRRRKHADHLGSGFDGGRVKS